MSQQTYGRYLVQRMLGRGGMAEVFEAIDPTLHRKVAIKVIYAHLASEGGFEARFLREAQLVASLRHPHIVQLYDFGIENDQPFMVMEYLDGGTLKDRLIELRASGQRMTLEESIRILTALAEALDYAHSRNAVHRDIKPGNILFTANNEPVLTDFGIAKLMGEAAQQFSVTGSVLGSPAYMSPEQAGGQTVDARSDLYALGVILYEMLSGRVPFQAESPTAVMMKHLTEMPPPLREFNKEISPALEAAVMKSLAKNPKDRYENAKALVRAVKATLQPIADTTLSPGEATLLQPVVSPTLPNITTKPETNSTQAAPKRKRPVWLFPIAGIILLLLIAGGAFLFVQNQQAGVKTDKNLFLRFRNATAINDEVAFSAKGLTPAPANKAYEVWLTGGESVVPKSIGILNIIDGKGTLVFDDPTRQNLVSMFDGAEITLEPSPDNNPMASGVVVATGQLPTNAFAHVRHVLVEHEGDLGYAIGLLQESRVLQTTAQNMLLAAKNNDLVGIKRAGEQITNVIEGKKGESFGDLDNDGTISNPGDGFGFLPNGDQHGYIQGTIDHAKLAAAMGDATGNIKLHAGHVQIAARNVSEWAISLRDLALQIAKATDIKEIQPQVQEAAKVANRLLNGEDVNGNEQIEPVVGEGGAEVAFEHSQFMADIILKLP